MRKKRVAIMALVVGAVGVIGVGILVLSVTFFKGKDMKKYSVSQLSRKIDTVKGLDPATTSVTTPSKIKKQAIVKSKKNTELSKRLNEFDEYQIMVENPSLGAAEDVASFYADKDIQEQTINAREEVLDELRKRYGDRIPASVFTKILDETDNTMEQGFNQTANPFAKPEQQFQAIVNAGANRIEEPIVAQ